MKLRCYGGPMDGDTVNVKHPGSRLLVQDPCGEPGKILRYDRQRFMRGDVGAVVSVYVYGDVDDVVAQRVAQDSHDLSAFESNQDEYAHRKHPSTA